MTQRRLLLVSVLVAWVGMIIACGGAGNGNGNGSSKTEVHGTANAADDARSKARAKAEAEAEAKNQANRKSYEAEVARLKAVNEEKYSAAKLAYEKDLSFYKVAKVEYDAAEKLFRARLLVNDKEKEIAQGRFREIVDQYSGTQAAKDAKVFLDGGFVAARESLTEPIAPQLPVEPTLILPPPPELVAVVYPPDVEEETPKLDSVPDDFKAQRTPDYGTVVRLPDGTNVYVRNLQALRTSAGKSVAVSGYYRKDGTYVQSYTCFAPAESGRFPRTG